MHAGKLPEPELTQLDFDAIKEEYNHGNRTAPIPIINAAMVDPICPPREFIVVMGSSILVPRSAHFRCIENICSEALRVMFSAGVMGFKLYSPIIDKPHNPI